MKGYFNKPKETAATIFKDGNKPWLRTGDIGYFDKRGCLYIVDRLKAWITIRWYDYRMLICKISRNSSKSRVFR